MGDGTGARARPHQSTSKEQRVAGQATGDGRGQATACPSIPGLPRGRPRGMLAALL